MCRVTNSGAGAMSAVDLVGQEMSGRCKYAANLHQRAHPTNEDALGATVAPAKAGHRLSKSTVHTTSCSDC